MKESTFCSSTKALLLDFIEIIASKGRNRYKEEENQVAARFVERTESRRRPGWRRVAPGEQGAGSGRIKLKHSGTAREDFHP